MAQLGKSVMNLLSPPDAIRGLTKFNKNLFDRVITVPILNVNNQQISEVINVVKKYFLKMENFKAVQQNVIHLNPNIIKDVSSFTPEEMTTLKRLNIELKYINLTLSYENYSHESLLKAILPEDKEGVSSFTKVGHIVHVNLREHLLPYKEIIGRILLDKIKSCDSVVNKVNMIDNTYRNFSMEILAGNDNTITQVKENGCKFEFDFSKVYWNSRLCTEHERIIKILRPGEVLFDVFAGVGPFALPAAKKNCLVHANDLNPESFKWLNRNVKLNRIKSIGTYRKDGKDFILNDIKTLLVKYRDRKIHVVMNLPALASEFLKYFVKLHDSDIGLRHPVNLYVYCFAKGEDYVEISKGLINNDIGFDVTDKITDVFKVRTVSSNKEMVRLTLEFDEGILCRNLKRKRDGEEDVERVQSGRREELES